MTKYSYFNTQLRQNQKQIPLLASIITETQYYVLFSDSFFYDFKIPVDFQSFSPHVHMPSTVVSFSNAQCFISLLSKNRLKFSPWKKFDIKLSEKYSKLYNCYNFQRNYNRITLRNNVATRISLFHRLNPFVLTNLPSSEKISAWFSYIKYPTLSLLGYSLLRSNFRKFFKRNENEKWPFENSLSNLIFQFFNPTKTTKRKLTLADGTLGINSITYAIKRKIINILNFRKNQKRFKPLKEEPSIFYAKIWDKYSRNKDGVIEEHIKEMHKRRKPVQCTTYYNYIYKMYIRTSRKGRRAHYLLGQTYRAIGSARFFYWNVLFHPKFKFSRSRNKKLLGTNWTYRTRDEYYKKLLMRLRTGERTFYGFAKHFKQRPRKGKLEGYYFVRSKIRKLRRYSSRIAALKIQFSRLYLRFINFLYFVKRYFNRFFRFIEFMKFNKQNFKFFKYLFRSSRIKRFKSKRFKQIQRVYANFIQITNQTRYQFFYNFFQIASYFNVTHKFKKFQSRIYSLKFISIFQNFLVFCSYPIKLSNLDWSYLYEILVSPRVNFQNIRTIDSSSNYNVNTLHIISKFNHLIYLNPRISNLRAYSNFALYFPNKHLKSLKIFRVVSSQPRIWIFKFFTSYRIK